MPKQNRFAHESKSVRKYRSKPSVTAGKKFGAGSFKGSISDLAADIRDAGSLSQLGALPPETQAKLGKWVAALLRAEGVEANVSSTERDYLQQMFQSEILEGPGVEYKPPVQSAKLRLRNKRTDLELKEQAFEVLQKLSAEGNAEAQQQLSELPDDYAQQLERQLVAVYKQEAQLDYSQEQNPQHGVKGKPVAENE